MLYFPSSFRLCLLLVALVLTTTSCDFGGAQDAVNSVGVAVELNTIKTTVTGTFTDAHTESLTKTPVTVQYKGPDADAVVDMYSDPMRRQTVRGGATSFGIHDVRAPTSQRPLRLNLLLNANGYLSTSKTVEVQSEGVTAVTAHLLSTDPRRQPKGASGTRDRSGKTTADGILRHAVNVHTPSVSTEGSAHLHLPKGARLYGETDPAQGILTTDLVHYPAQGTSLYALPGDGTIQDKNSTTRFGLVGYMHLRMQGEHGQIVSQVTSPTNAGTTNIWVHLSDDAVHPGTGAPLRAGDELTLYRYHSSAGTWSEDTTVTVQDPKTNAKQSAGRSSFTTASHDSDSGLGIQWTSWSRAASQLWAWGTPRMASCPVQATVSMTTNGHEGSLQAILQRPGYAFQATASIDDLTDDGTVPLSQLIGSSTVPDASDYTLTVTIPSGKSVTTAPVNPCGGTQSITLPSAPSGGRTDVLFRAAPECPGDQKVRVSSLPAFPVYYRKTGTSTWQVAGSGRINWVMNDPNSPTYLEAAELRLDGLKQNTQYEVFTIYDGVRHDASDHVPDRSTATLEDGRVVVEYSQDFSNACS